MNFALLLTETPEILAFQRKIFSFHRNILKTVKSIKPHLLYATTLEQRRESSHGMITLSWIKNEIIGS